MVAHRPKWRAPLSKPRPPNRLSAAFLAARNPYAAPRCEAIARSTGKKCGAIALRGAKYCKAHGGLIAAAKAEEARTGRAVLILRTPRKKSLSEYGANAPWPEGLPKRDDFMQLGPWARGKLFEAWENRLLSPGTWKHELTRPRVRNGIRR